MAGNAKSDGITPDIAVGLLQDALANLQEAGLQPLAGAVDWRGAPALIILLPGATLEDAPDGKKIVLAGTANAASTPAEAHNGG